MGKGVGRGREMEEWREGRRLGGQGNGGDGEKERTSNVVTETVFRP